MARAVSSAQREEIEVSGRLGKGRMVGASDFVLFVVNFRIGWDRVINMVMPFYEVVVVFLLIFYACNGFSQESLRAVVR